MSLISRVNWNKTIFFKQETFDKCCLNFNEHLYCNVCVASCSCLWLLEDSKQCRRNYKTCSWMDCYTTCMIIRQCLHLLCKTDRSHQYLFTFIYIKLCNEIFMVRLILSNTFSTTFHIMWILIGKIYLKWKKIFKLIGYK